MMIWLLSHVRLLATPWAVAHQAPLSMEFSRQEYWSGLPFPSRGDLPEGIFPTQESNLGLLHCRQILYWLSYEGSPKFVELGACKASVSSLIAVTRILWACTVLDNFLAHSSPRRQVLRWPSSYTWGGWGLASRVPHPCPLARRWQNWNLSLYRETCILLVSWFSTKVQSDFSGTRMVFFNMSARTIGYPLLFIVCCCSVHKSCPTLQPHGLQHAWLPCPSPSLPEFAQTHVHWVGDAIHHLILCHPFLLLPSIFPSIRVFCNELVWPQY